jgi:uncharacterized protein YlzI (FlbEa/FlbD family)
VHSSKNNMINKIVEYIVFALGRMIQLGSAVLNAHMINVHTSHPAQTTITMMINGKKCTKSVTNKGFNDVLSITT